MKIAEAKAEVLRTWDSWAPKNVPSTRKPNGHDGFTFFTYLQRERPHLLTFRAKGDQWQVVHGWLLQGRRVTD
jgi:hypothetical protein